VIGIVDYGAGNLRSVAKAFEFLGAPTRIIAGPNDFPGVDRLVLPGVGAYGAALDHLNARGIFRPVVDWLAADRPFLGICLGLQLLFDESEEAPGGKGLARFRGRARKFEARKVPQIGWNGVKFTRSVRFFQKISSGSYFFFLHSYYVLPADPSIAIASARYGNEFAAAVQHGSVYGVQFHPEKSGDLGLQLLKNWIEDGN
jgi:imidazole glycerol phosphate synthase glutamine amidotransferase subunit